MSSERDLKLLRRVGEADAAHLPRGHLAKVAGTRVAVPLDRDHRRGAVEPDRVIEFTLGAPEARRQRDVASLVELVLRHVALAIERRLIAHELPKLQTRQTTVPQEPQ